MGPNPWTEPCSRGEAIPWRRTYARIHREMPPTGFHLSPIASWMRASQSVGYGLTTTTSGIVTHCSGFAGSSTFWHSIAGCPLPAGPRVPMWAHPLAGLL